MCKKLIFFVCFVLVMVFVGTVQAFTPPQNGGFENGFANWTTWQWGNAPPLAGNPSISANPSGIESASAYEGFASAQCDTGPGVWGGGCGAFNGVLIGENVPVTMSAYARGVATGGFVGIDLCFFAIAPEPNAMNPPTIGRVELPLNLFGAPDAFGWRYGLLSAVTPATTTYVKFEISDNGNPGPSPILFDNIVGTPEPATIALLGLGGLALIRRKR